jgi:hypothetical protein
MDGNTGATVLRLYREVPPNVGQTKPTKLPPIVRYIFWRGLLRDSLQPRPQLP